MDGEEEPRKDGTAENRIFFAKAVYNNFKMNWVHTFEKQLRHF